eukprot:3693698-Prymnesium_polylepis.2
MRLFYFLSYRGAPKLTLPKVVQSLTARPRYSMLSPHSGRVSCIHEHDHVGGEFWLSWSREYFNPNDLTDH